MTALDYRHGHRAGRHEFEWGDPDRALLELDYIRSDRGEVTAEMAATSTAPTGGLVHVARVNLLSTRSLAEYAGHVTRRTNGTGADWQRLVSIAAVETVRAVREGAPAVLLRDVPPAPDAGHILPPLLVGRMPTILFGDGGSAKSLIALAAAASITSGEPLLGLRPTVTTRVGFCDWEMDGAEHRDRLERLAGLLAPDVVYVSCARPLVDDVDRLRRIIGRHELGYLVIDSVGVACDGPPEAAEVANRFFGALRELGLGSLLVAHVNRSGDTDRPFGSAYWHNNARATWYAKLEAEIGGSMTVGLFNKKANTAARSAPLGYRIEWGERIILERTDLRDIPDLASHVPLSYRVADELRTGAQTVAAIAAAVDADVETVRRTLNRKKDRFVSTTGADGVVRWGLLETRERSS